ncbi:formin-like protein 5 [Iris pallida]|uniref:Formin-like protein 5 n=1 Tax=Iris pallida TaxID=29817 RepID=A0AAX6I5Q7_IRIPA|nr:formin-like protein 5 [Iris pallida]
MDQSPPPLLSDTTTSPHQHQQLANHLLPGRAPPATTPVSSAWLGHSRHLHAQPLLHLLHLIESATTIIRSSNDSGQPLSTCSTVVLVATGRACEDNSCSSSDHRQQRAPPCRAHRRCSAAVDGHAPPWAAPPAVGDHRRLPWVRHLVLWHDV